MSCRELKCHGTICNVASSLHCGFPATPARKNAAVAYACPNGAHGVAVAAYYVNMCEVRVCVCGIVHLSACHGISADRYR